MTTSLRPEHNETIRYRALRLLEHSALRALGKAKCVLYDVKAALPADDELPPVTAKARERIKGFATRPDR